MKNTLLFVAAAVLLGWLFWPNAVRPPQPERTAPIVPVPAPAASNSAESRQSEPATELHRQPIDPPIGPTGIRVTCVWASDGSQAATIPLTVRKAHGEQVATGTTDAAGIVTFTELEAAEYTVRFSRTKASTTVTAGIVADVKLTLKEKAVVAGTVIDSASAPVANADVVAEVYYFPYTVGKTGPDGRFRVRLPSRGRIWACKEGYQPSTIGKIKGNTDDLTLQLAAATSSIRGIVLDPDGRAVARAIVTITDHVLNGPAKQPPVRLETDAQGEFATTEVKPGKLLVYARADGFAFGQQVADNADNDGSPVVVRLRLAASVRGIAFGGEQGNEPLAGVSMQIYRQRDLPGILRGMSDRFTRIDTVTDSAGRYQMTGIPPGRMWIIAGSRHAMKFRNSLLREGEDLEWNPDLTPPPGVIVGVLLGPDDEPLADWHVRATRLDLVQMNQEMSRSKTNADGRFELLKLNLFPHKVTVMTSEYGQVFAQRDDVTPNQTELVWRLPSLPSQCGTIAGHLVHIDGSPVAAAKFEARKEGVTRTGTPTTGDAGGFHIRDVTPGTWHVVGKLEDYGSFDLGSFVVQAKTTVDIGSHRLPPRGTAVVRLNGQGFDPDKIEIALQQIEGGTNKTSDFTARNKAHYSAPLPRGLYRLDVRGTNFAPIRREVQIPPNAEIAVELVPRPATPVAFEFVPENLDGKNWQDGVRFELRDAAGGLVWKGNKDVSGAATATLVVGLAAGAYRIEASSPLGAYRRGSATFVVRAPATKTLNVRVLLTVLR
jgi:hypothetical protein